MSMRVGHRDLEVMLGSVTDRSGVGARESDAGFSQPERVVDGQVALEECPPGRLIADERCEVISKCHAATLAAVAAAATSGQRRSTVDPRPVSAVRT